MGNKVVASYCTPVPNASELIEYTLVDDLLHVKTRAPAETIEQVFPLRAFASEETTVTFRPHPVILTNTTKGLFAGGVMLGFAGVVLHADGKLTADWPRWFFGGCSVTLLWIGAVLALIRWLSRDRREWRSIEFRYRRVCGPAIPIAVLGCESDYDRQNQFLDALRSQIGRATATVVVPPTAGSDAAPSRALAALTATTPDNTVVEFTLFPDRIHARSTSRWQSAESNWPLAEFSGEELLRTYRRTVVWTEFMGGAAMASALLWPLGVILLFGAPEQVAVGGGMLATALAASVFIGSRYALHDWREWRSASLLRPRAEDPSLLVEILCDATLFSQQEMFLEAVRRQMQTLRTPIPTSMPLVVKSTPDATLARFVVACGPGWCLEYELGANLRLRFRERGRLIETAYELHRFRLGDTTRTMTERFVLWTQVTKFMVFLTGLAILGGALMMLVSWGERNPTGRIVGLALVLSVPAAFAGLLAIRAWFHDWRERKVFEFEYAREGEPAEKVEVMSFSDGYEEQESFADALREEIRRAQRASRA